MQGTFDQQMVMTKPALAMLKAFHVAALFAALKPLVQVKLMASIVTALLAALQTLLLKQKQKQKPSLRRTQQIPTLLERKGWMFPLPSHYSYRPAEAC